MSKKKKLPPKPRNPFVSHIRVKKQGAHSVSKKAERARSKVRVRKDSDLYSFPVAA